MATTADIYSHLDYSNKITVGNAIGGLFGGNPFSESDDAPKEQILQGDNNYVNDEQSESGFDEYDTGNNINIVANKKPSENEKHKVEITDEEYAEYLKWKKQSGRNPAET